MENQNPSHFEKWIPILLTGTVKSPIGTKTTKNKYKKNHRLLPSEFK